MKIPKYIQKELQKANNYSYKSSQCIKKFEKWVETNIDENYDFGNLRGCDNNALREEVTEALTEIEMGYNNESVQEDINRIQNCLNVYLENRKT